MGLLSVTLNLITLFLVGCMVYIINKLYKTGSEQGIGALDVMRNLENNPETISHAYLHDQYGEWTPAKGLDWADDINSTENQNSLSIYPIIN